MPAVDKKSVISSFIIVSWHFMLSYMVFTLVIWAWVTGWAGSLWPRYKLANAFDAKIGTQDALSKLMTCIHNSLPDRNATIADLVACLRHIGVKNILRR